LFQQALHIWEQARGPEHPQVASALNGLAKLYRQQSKYEQAEASYRRALTIREQHLGPHHPETARSLAGLALLYEKQGNDEQAELLLQRACTIFEQHLGQADPEAVKTRNDYQNLIEQRRRATEALIEEQQEHAHQNTLPLNMLSEEAEASTTQEPDPQPPSKEPRRPLRPDLHVVVRGRSAQIAYTRTVRMREVTITCVVCGKTVTQLHYPSGRIKYCSEMCRDAKRAQMHEERVRSNARSAELNARWTNKLSSRKCDHHVQVLITAPTTWDIR
jgi:tetratricopeptide (TPR) repeat protein